VNEVRIETRDLLPGDEIRLGGLKIFLEREEAAVPVDESTVFLAAATAPVPETATVALPRDSVPALPDPSTVFLQCAPGNIDDADETLKKPEPERTVMLPGQAPAQAYETGTVLYRGQVDRELETGTAATRIAPVETPPSPAQDIELVEDDPEESLPELSASVTFVPQPARGGWRSLAKLAPLAAALVVFAFLVVALPLLRILGAALVEESSSRGLVLVDLLAAENEVPLSEGISREVSVDRVAAEPGVVAAYVLGPTGQILAPRERAGETLRIEGLSFDASSIRSFHEGRSPNGDRILAQPILHRGRQVGLAVLQHRPKSADLPWAALLLGSILLAMAALGVVVLTRRMTVSPLNELRLEVDELGQGRRKALPVPRPYSELSQLASSLNRVLAEPRREKTPRNH
jgi:hypothetical protein